MKKFFPLLLIIAACSSGKKEKQEPFPFLQVSESEWATYEGKMITEEGRIADIEISLKEGAVGVNSYYRLNATVEINDHRYGGMDQGDYSVTYGLPNNELGITINEWDKGQLTGRYVQSVRNKKPIIREFGNLYFKTKGNDQLVLTDKHFNPIAEDDRYTIYKRSKLFTIEGYLTVEPDEDTEFFERNTRENWNVAQLGLYSEVKSTYKQLAKVPFEGIYLRALAYAVADTTVNGDPIDRLVVKEVIKMEAGHQFVH